MSTYRRLPALLRRIDALESGAVLCRRRDCYSPLGLFATGAVCGFCSSRFALMAQYRLGYGLGMGTPPSRSSLAPFVAITAC